MKNFALELAKKIKNIDLKALGKNIFYSLLGIAILISSSPGTVLKTKAAARDSVSQEDLIATSEIKDTKTSETSEEIVIVFSDPTKEIEEKRKQEENPQRSGHTKVISKTALKLTSDNDEIDNTKIKSPQVLGVNNQTIQQKSGEISAFYSNLQVKVEQYKVKQAKINRLVAFLANQGSPVASNYYADLIISLSEDSGADYRIIVSIMGVESGFCSANYKKYNCFGYLNGVQYANFEQAFRRLVPAVAKQYAIPYGTNFEAMLKAYGVHEVDYHCSRMRYYYNSLS